MQIKPDQPAVLSRSAGLTARHPTGRGRHLMFGIVERRLHVSQRFSMLCRPAILVGVAVAGVLGAPIGVMAQAFKDLQTPDTPLVLKAQGSFFIGGEKSGQTRVELGGLGP